MTILIVLFKYHNLCFPRARSLVYMIPNFAARRSLLYMIPHNFAAKLSPVYMIPLLLISLQSLIFVKKHCLPFLVNNGKLKLL